MSFEFLDCMALATVPAKLLLDLLLPLPIYLLTHVWGSAAERVETKRWQRELVIYIVEVPSDQNSGSDSDDNL